MKRKRALDVSENSQETMKIKKQRSQVKNENTNFMLDENTHESTDSTLQPVLKNLRKKGINARSSSSVVESTSVIDSVQPGTSAGNSNRKKRKPKGDINQNDDASESIQVIDSKISVNMLRKRQRNGLQTRATANSSSDLPVNSNDEEEGIIEGNTNNLHPIKKKPGRKPGFTTNLESAKKSEQQELPKNSSKKSIGVRYGVLKTSNKNKRLQEVQQSDEFEGMEPATIESGNKKTKKKVRIDETESLKVKKELAEAESHFSAKELPAKIIKSKSNKNLTEEVKVSPLTVQNSKKEKKSLKKIKEEDGNLEEEHLKNGIKSEPGATSEESDLEVYYINKNAEKEARKKSTRKYSISMPKEDQLILVQRMQEVIPEDDTKSYKYRLQNLEWQKIAFNNYSIEECQNVWTQLLKKVRHYRLLVEITHDVRQVIEFNDLQEVTQKKTKANPKKHPDMPKRPLTSYFLYYIRKRDKIGKERSELDSIELNKYISEMYQNLPPEKKQKYELLAAKNKEEYKKQLEEFYAKHPEMRKVVIKKEPKRRKEKPPTRPEIPYKLFVQSELNREEIAEDDKAEFKEVCREKWRQMSDSKKLGWINLAEEHHMKYEEELKEYMARHPEYTPKTQPHKPFLTQKEISLKDKLAGKPKKPPGTAYGLFISMTVQSNEIVDIPPRERWNYTSTRWKAMSDEEREQYKQLLTQVHGQYQKDFQVYLDSLPEDKRQAEILKNLPKKRKKAPSGTKPKSTQIKSQTSRVKNTKQKIQNPVPPPRSAYKYFAEKFEGENPKESWKNLDASEKEKYEGELSAIKDKYIKDFETYLKSLTKDELSAFCANRGSQEEYSSSDGSDSESDHGDELSSDESSDSSDSENDSDEN